MSLAAVANNKSAVNVPVYQKMAMQAQDLFLQVCDEQTWKRELSFALQILEGNKLLQSAAQTPAGAQSIKNAIINVAMTGTTLNPVLKKAYLVPRSVNNVMTCCLDFSYQGLTGIAIDSGSVKHISASLVYNFDHFEYEVVDGEVKFKHRPSLNPPEEFITGGAAKFWDFIVCGYCVATLHDGTKQVFSPFLKWKLKKAMDTSKTTGANTPWRTHTDEMCLKTILKHEYKLLPQTDRMSQAVSVLNEHEGLDLDADRRITARAAAAAMFGTAEDAEVILPASGTQKTSRPAPAAANAGETTVVPVIGPNECEEILRKAEEAGVNLEKLLSFLEVKHLSDLPQSSYVTALAAIESKRRQSDTKGAGSTSSVASEQQNNAPAAGGNSFNDIVNALAAKNVMYQMDEEAGYIQAKLSYQDTANKEFVKSLGFRWDAEGKVWTWRQQ